MRNARVRMTGVMADAQRTRPQTAGTIRAGIKVLTRDAASKPELVAIYNEGVAAGATFDQITLSLKKVKGCPDYPLTPSNAPYFRVNQSDFAYPGAAQYILDTYGEDRGEGQHLYNFPIILASDDVDEVFAETFEAWKASDLQFWSEQDANGVLQCMQRQKVAPDRSRRRQWGGRPVEVVKPCEPNACDVFNTGNCKHSATLYFWVPGVRGAGLIELPFTSLYASAGIVEILEKVTAGLGRIRGMFDGKPIFRVSKRLKSVARFDWQTGKATRSDHWIIHLDADLDMCQIISGADLPALPCPPVSIEPETEPQADPAAAVRTLRATLKSLMEQFNPPWSSTDLGDWMRIEGFGSRDADCVPGLSEMVDLLAAKLASIKSTPELQTAPTHEPEDQAAPEPAHEPQVSHAHEPDADTTPETQGAPTTTPEPQDAPAPMPTQPDPSPQPDIATLRKLASAKAKEIGWTAKEFMAWVQVQGYAPADFRDHDTLLGVVARLDEILARKDDDVPF